ncbi:hypothetical protein F7725_023225 [Dissostichus mawsoni]|uniref:Uncharacterized protein n=1 Tax=Dissostichus mawsoni TaxID=36200 RepID=A0A7J5Z0G3_DISMA|nr:hypothetical protein F7725_023225 [Dissostichus mawsoni]
MHREKEHFNTIKPKWTAGGGIMERNTVQCSADHFAVISAPIMPLGRQRAAWWRRRRREHTEHADGQTAGGEGGLPVEEVVRADVVPQVGGAAGNPEGRGAEEAGAERASMLSLGESYVTVGKQLTRLARTGRREESVRRAAFGGLAGRRFREDLRESRG